MSNALGRPVAPEVQGFCASDRPIGNGARYVH